MADGARSRTDALTFIDNGKGRCQICGKMQKAHYSAVHLFCYGGWSYRGCEGNEELGKCLQCYKAKEEHFTRALFCYELPPDKCHEVSESPGGTISVTLRHNPKGLILSTWRDPGLSRHARAPSMMSAVGFGSTTLQESLNLGHRRLPTVKVCFFCFCACIAQCERDARVMSAEMHTPPGVRAQSASRRPAGTRRVHQRRGRHAAPHWSTLMPELMM